MQVCFPDWDHSSDMRKMRDVYLAHRELFVVHKKTPGHQVVVPHQPPVCSNNFREQEHIWINLLNWQGNWRHYPRSCNTATANNKWKHLWLWWSVDTVLVVMICVWGLPCQEPGRVPPGEYISGARCRWRGVGGKQPSTGGNSFLPSNDR